MKIKETRLSILFLLICSWVTASTTADEKPGQIDLRNWDLSEEPSVELNAEWEFFWETLPEAIDSYKRPKGIPQHVSVPCKWQDIPNVSPTGFATYRVTVLVPKDLPIMAFSIPPIKSSFRFWANGKLVAEDGTPGTNKSNSTPEFKSQTKTFVVDKDSLELIIQIANFHHARGGISHPISFGESDHLLRNRELMGNFAFLMTGSVFMGGIFFLGLFFFARENRDILLFAIFCIIYSYRICGADMYFLKSAFPDMSFELSIRLEYLSLYVCVLLVIEFLKLMLQDEFNQIIYKAGQVIFSCFILIVLLFEPLYFTQTTNPFLFCTVLYVFYGLSLFIRVLFKGETDVFFALMTIFSLATLLTVQLAGYYGFIKSNSFTFYFGNLSFFLFQSIILSNRYTISFRKAMENEKTSNKAKAEFLATMSHEIRTPMNGVIGMANLLSETKLTPEQKEYVDTIRLSGDNLITIINDILDFSKIESGNIEFEETPIQLQTILDEVLDLLSPKIKSKNLGLFYLIESDVPKKLHGDDTRIKQILINLINNAIKFTEKGEIYIRVKFIEKIEGKIALQFDVTDSGIGISSEKIERLFRQFSQADSSISRKYGGTGLGLAICKKLTKMMGGSIWVESEVGKGSTFSFIIKLKENKGPITPKIQTQNYSFSTAIICNHPVFEELLKQHLIERNQKGTFFKNADDLLKSDVSKFKHLIVCEPKQVVKIPQIVDRTKELNLSIISIGFEIPKVWASENHTFRSVQMPIKSRQIDLILSKVVQEPKTYELENSSETVPKRTFAEQHPMRILLAEDHPINQKLAFTILKKMGYTVDIAANGLEVLKAMELKTYDFIFMDMQMPEMDGLEATRQIISTYEENAPVIVAMTANVMEADKQRCFDAGMLDFIGKPIKPNTIENSLAKWEPIIRLREKEQSNIINA